MILIGTSSEEYEPTITLDSQDDIYFAAAINNPNLFGPSIG